MDAPLVSVIVPNYNYARYLEERLESILTQRFQDFELILLDDCSTDESRSILERYASHPKVSHYLPNEQNSGSPFAQWERGLELARGRYVWIAESDDSCTPELLERLVAALEARPDAVLAYCGSLQVDEYGERLPRDYDRWQEDQQLYTYSPSYYLRHRLSRENSIYNASMVVFRREAWLRLEDKAYLGMRSCGDWLFWIKLVEQGVVLELRSKLNRFRQHTQRVTVRSDQSGARLSEHVAITRYLNAHGYPSRWEQRLRRGHLYKQTLRLNRDKASRTHALQELHRAIGATRADYILERIYKVVRELVGKKG